MRSSETILWVSFAHQCLCVFLFICACVFSYIIRSKKTKAYKETENYKHLLNISLLYTYSVYSIADYTFYNVDMDMSNEYVFMCALVVFKTNGKNTAA